MAEEKFSVSWSWLKEQIATAAVNATVAGLMFLVGWAILQAFVGDAKLEQAKKEIRDEFVERHNEAVARESDLIKLLHEQRIVIEGLQKAPQLPPPLPPIIGPIGGSGPVEPGPTPNVQQQVPNVQQKSPDAAKLDWQEKYRDRILNKK